MQNFDTARNKFRALNDLSGISEDNISHKSYTVLDHTKNVFYNGIFFIDFIDITLGKKLNLTERSKDIFLLKCLLHDIGKANTGVYVDGQKIFTGHELVGRKIANEILLELILTPSEKEDVAEFIGTHTDIHTCLDGGTREFEYRLKQFNRNHKNIRDYLIFGLADLYDSHLRISKPNEYLYRIYTLLNAIEDLIV